MRAALKKQQKQKDILKLPLPPRTVKLGKTPAIKMVFTKQRPATDTAPEATLLVYRYLLYHDDHIVILSLQSPDTVDNKLAYKLVADSFGCASSGGAEGGVDVHVQLLDHLVAVRRSRPPARRPRRRDRAAP